MSVPTMLPQHVFPFGYIFVYAAFGVSGFVLGWVAQRGNYCFVNAMSSIFTTKSYDRFGALLILFGVSALLTGLLSSSASCPPSISTMTTTSRDGTSWSARRSSDSVPRWRAAATSRCSTGQRAATSRTGWSWSG